MAHILLSMWQKILVQMVQENRLEYMLGSVLHEQAIDAASGDDSV
jgi:hypothetical protein